MKRTALTVLMVLWFLCAGAQSWNPYVSLGMINPNPLLPKEFNGSGIISFTVGNSGDKPVKLKSDQEMTLVISLSYGIPDSSDPLSAIGGDWADKFSWTYNTSLFTYTGIQNRDIPADSRGTITIQYKVSGNSPAGNASNGFNVNLQQPPYTNGINLTEDDAVSFYTYVLARDYGDAPSSYGTAVHEINIYKNPETGAYENYIFMGSGVDPETTDQPSQAADSDDNNLSDDEDGVTFPELIRGDTVTIPVKITIKEVGSGALNAWLDWNGDGDFADPGEKIAGPLALFETGTTSLTVVVPENSIITRPTYARFRLGDFKNSSETGPDTWGEVEDYSISISGVKELSITKTLMSTRDNDSSGTISIDDILTCKITVLNRSARVLSNVTVNDDKIRPGHASCQVLPPGSVCVLTGSYIVTREDMDAGGVLTTTTVDSDETEPFVKKEML